MQHEDTEGNEISRMSSGQDHFAKSRCNQNEPEGICIKSLKRQNLMPHQRLVMTQFLKMKVKAAKSNRSNVSFGRKR